MPVAVPVVASARQEHGLWIRAVWTLKPSHACSCCYTSVNSISRLLPGLQVKISNALRTTSAAFVPAHILCLFSLTLPTATTPSPQPFVYSHITHNQTSPTLYHLNTVMEANGGSLPATDVEFVMLCLKHVESISFDWKEIAKEVNINRPGNA
jgi:hypothetical protein